MTDLPRCDHPASGAFRIAERTYVPATGELLLTYRFDGDDDGFVERITFEGPRHTPDGVHDPGFERALLLLHAAAGTSYYKTTAPDEVVVEGAELARDEEDFLHHLYDDGLREFAVANGLSVPRPVTVRSAQTAQTAQTGPAAPRPGGRNRNGLVVPVGGGKDSVVLFDALAPFSPRLLAVNPHPLVEELAAAAGLELLIVRRVLSPRLEACNRAGALNGHVPITAIISLIAVVGSFVYGYDTIAMAIERSASEETVVVDGVPVNHQYSKSLEVEVMLRDLLRDRVDPGLRFGSPLRPYSELAIARRFARLTKYHPTFCSCNSAFRSSASAGDRWCGNCPKCRFVALMLAPYLAPAAIGAIIGADLFEDPAQIEGFAALMSDRDKPFECVGERRESAVAMAMLGSMPDWQASAVVVALAPVAAALVDDQARTDLLTPRATPPFGDAEVEAAVDRALGSDP